MIRYIFLLLFVALFGFTLHFTGFTFDFSQASFSSTQEVTKPRNTVPEQQKQRMAREQEPGAVAATASAPILTRGPYLQMGSTQAITLRWRTNVPSSSLVEVGTTYGAYPLRAFDPTLTTEHEIRIGNLRPNTRYYYRFGSESQVLQAGQDNYFFTAPRNRNPHKVRIAVFGDCGRNSYGVQTKTLQAYLQHVGNRPAELLLLLGDNAYVRGTDAEYQARFFNAYGSTILKNHVMFPSPGNHDYKTTSQASRQAPYFKFFSMPTQGESGGVPSGTKAYYSFDWGDIHFISLDSYGIEPDNSRLYDTLGAQVSWLKRDLAATTKPWVIVFWHHAPYSMGSHNSDTDSYMSRLRRNLNPIMERNGVDLVLTGHSHNYERSYLLRGHFGPEATFDSRRHAVSSSSGRYNSSRATAAPYLTVNGKVNHGTVYVVSGSAGTTGEIQPSWPHKALPWSDNKGGMLYLEVEQNRLDAKYLRSDGRVWDQFTIMKDVNKTRRIVRSNNTPIRLTASWVGNYLWSTGETTRSITVNPSSDATYQVRDLWGHLRDRFEVRYEAESITAAMNQEQDPNQQQQADTLANTSQQSQQLRIYPTLVSRGNPIQVQVPGKEPFVVTVTDLNGRLFYGTRSAGATVLETSRLSGGLYVVRLRGEGFDKAWKVVVRE